MAVPFFEADAYQYAPAGEMGGAGSGLAVRDDGSVAAAHKLSSFYGGFLIRVWDPGGGLLWESELDGSLARAGRLSAHPSGDLLFGSDWGTLNPRLTRVSGETGSAVWIYEPEEGIGLQSVGDVVVDSNGTLLAAMTLLNPGGLVQFDTDIVVRALDFVTGTETGWEVRWDGQDSMADSSSLDEVDALMIDPLSERVFVAGVSGSDAHELVVIAWDPPSTTPTWLKLLSPPVGVWESSGLALTGSGALVVMGRTLWGKAFWVSIDPEDGTLLSTVTDAELGLTSHYPWSMAPTADGGVAIAGSAAAEPPDHNPFLLRLDADLQPVCYGEIEQPSNYRLDQLRVGPDGRTFAGGWSSVPSDEIDNDTIFYTALVVEWLWP